MTIKAGILAFVVRPLGVNYDALGMVVEVLEMRGVKNFAAGPEEACWIRAPRPLRTMLGSLQREALVRCSSLRPIGDPGDDAVDETLLRLPSPRQEVTA